MCVQRDRARDLDQVSSVGLAINLREICTDWPTNCEEKRRENKKQINSKRRKERRKERKKKKHRKKPTISRGSHFQEAQGLLRNNLHFFFIQRSWPETSSSSSLTGGGRTKNWPKNYLSRVKREHRKREAMRTERTRSARSVLLFCMCLNKNP